MLLDVMIHIFCIKLSCSTVDNSSLHCVSLMNFLLIPRTREVDVAVADELIARQLQRTRSIHSLRTLSRQRTHRSHPVQQPPIHDDQIAWLIVDRDQTISQEQSATAPQVGWVRVVDGDCKVQLRCAVCRWKVWPPPQIGHVSGRDWADSDTVVDGSWVLLKAT